MLQQFPLVDLFAGAGGMSLGLRNAGFMPVFACDFDPHACATYRHNLGNHIHQGDANEVTSEFICQHTGIKPGGYSLVCGGPPCQGFSVQRRGEENDPRNDLVVRFTRIATDLHPLCIVMENVPTLLGKRGNAVLSEAVGLLKGRHYDVVYTVLDAADFGVPQHRRRAFLVAWDPTRVGSFEFPKPIGERITVRKALEGLPEPPDDYTEDEDFANHIKVRISDINETRISYVPPGGARADLPPELQLPCHRKDNGHRHLDVYGRMHWDKPAPTITAMFDNFTRGRFAHPEKNRSITSREGARIQSFPDSFVFSGPKKDVARQIGNAVPPKLAYYIGKAIMNALCTLPSAGVSAQQMSLSFLDEVSVIAAAAAVR